MAGSPQPPHKRPRTAQTASQASSVSENAGAAPDATLDEAPGHAPARTATFLYDAKARTLAMAAFDDDSATLSWGSVQARDHELDVLLQIAKQQLAPKSIVLSAAMFDSLGPALERPAFIDADTEAYNPDTDHAVDLHRVPAGDFSLLTAPTVLGAVLVRELVDAADQGRGTSIRVAGRSAHRGASARGMEALADARYQERLENVLPWDTPAVICALAGLVNHIAQKALLELGAPRATDEPLLTVSRLSLLQLELFMWLDWGVMRALQIQAPEDHPALVQGAGRRKEGFTLLGQFDTCLTTLGRSALRDWFRKPLLDVAAIARRHDAIDLFTKDALGEHVEALAKQLRKVKDVPALLRLVRTATAAPRHWAALAASLRGLLAIRSLLDRVEGAGGDEEEDFPDLVSQMQSAIAPPVAEVSGLLETVLDLEGIGPGDLSVHIKEGVSEDLDKWRRVLDNLDNILSEEGTRVLSSLAPHGVQELALVFLPRVGYVARVPTSGLVSPLPDGCRVSFSEPGLHYLKTPTTDTLDERLGDIHARVRDAELYIMGELEERVLEEEVAMRDAAFAAAELDVVLALGRAAVRFGLVRPAVVEEPVLSIKNGRHVLQELTVETLVPNDAELPPSDESDARTLVVTGPNGSGKSVYMKMIGINTFLAQIGSFVAADSATIGVVDRLFVRVQTVESAGVAHSTFAIDTLQMATMMRLATTRSLLLIDEYGKGTDMADGISLAAACIKTLRVRAAAEGGAVFVTHMHELVSMGLLRDSGCAFSCMAIHVERGPVAGPGAGVEIAPDPTDTRTAVVPLFRVGRGVTAASFALACAHRTGVPPAVVDRAATVLRAMQGGEGADTLQPRVTEEDEAVSAAALRLAPAVTCPVSAPNWLSANDMELQGAVLRITAFRSALDNRYMHLDAAEPRSAQRRANDAAPSGGGAPGVAEQRPVTARASFAITAAEGARPVLEARPIERTGLRAATESRSIVRRNTTTPTTTLAPIAPPAAPSPTHVGAMGGPGTAGDGAAPAPAQDEEGGQETAGRLQEQEDSDQGPVSERNDAPSAEVLPLPTAASPGPDEPTMAEESCSEHGSQSDSQGSGAPTPAVRGVARRE